MHKKEDSLNEYFQRDTHKERSQKMTTKIHVSKNLYCSSTSIAMHITTSMHPTPQMLKLDGLTTKRIYENGKLVQASMRGDGDVGEDITHNIPTFRNVPLSIAYPDRLVITGESIILQNDFERLKTVLLDQNGKPYKKGLLSAMVFGYKKHLIWVLEKSKL